MTSIWSNFDASLPSTLIVSKEDTSAPLPYNNTISKNDENDSYGKIKTQYFRQIKNILNICLNKLKTEDVICFNF